jgi:hypothetical protein
MNFTVNENEYTIRYYLDDDIYPLWLVFMNDISLPQPEKHQFFLEKQTSLWKDADCAFVLLKKRFNILAIFGRSYSQRILGLSCELALFCTT